MFKTRIFNVLLALVAAFAIIAFASSVAAEEKKGGGKKRKERVTYAAVFDSGVMLLYVEPCTSKKVKLYIPPAYLPVFFNGRIEMDGDKFEICWTQPDPDSVAVVAEDGSQAVVPWGMFRAVSTS